MGSGPDQPKLPGPGYDLQPGVCKGAGGPASGRGDGLCHKRGGYTGSDPAIRGERLGISDAAGQPFSDISDPGCLRRVWSGLLWDPGRGG